MITDIPKIAGYLRSVLGHDMGMPGRMLLRAMLHNPEAPLKRGCHKYQVTNGTARIYPGGSFAIVTAEGAKLFMLTGVVNGNRNFVIREPDDPGKAYEHQAKRDNGLFAGYGTWGTW